VTGVEGFNIGDKVFAATGVGGICEKILAHKNNVRTHT
jgi:hypothetical protein